MRYRMTFRVPVPRTRIPLSYNEALSAHLAEWLGVIPPLPDGHDPASMPFDHFVFSRLVIKSKIVDMKSLTIRLLSPTVVLYLGIPEAGGDNPRSPSALLGREVLLGTEGQNLLIERVEALPPPIWSRRMNFRMLSPTAVPGPDGTWLRADDPRLSETIRLLLLNRYRSHFNHSPSVDEELTAVVDPTYLSQRGGGAGVVKRVRLNATGGEPRDVHGFVCPITLRGNPRLIALAYDSGLGTLGMLGFGMMG